jgi:branched-chain amino acid transport system permease protein
MSGVLVVEVVPSKLQTQGGAIQAILIGVLLVAMLIFRPRGLLGERLHSSPLLRDDASASRQ